MKINDMRSRTSSTRLYYYEQLSTETVPRKMDSYRGINQVQTTGSYRGKPVEDKILYRYPESNTVNVWRMPNDFSLQKQQFDAGEQKVIIERYSNQNRSYTIWGPLLMIWHQQGSFGPLPSLETSTNRNRCRDMAVIKLYEAVTAPKFDTVVWAVEGLESLGLITNALRSASLAFQKARILAFYRKRAKISAPSMSDLTEAWLLCRYGILPMLLQIEDMIKAMVDEPLGVIGFTASHKIREKSTELSHTVSMHGCDLTVRVDTVESTFAVARCVAELGGRPAPFGTSLTDLARAGWEKIPFSFVVDWFLSIGDWLSTLRPGESGILSSYVTTLDKVSRQAKLTGIVNRLAPGDGSYFIGSPIEIQTLVFDRVCDPSLPKLPIINPSPLAWYRQLDAIALGWQLLIEPFIPKGVKKKH